MGWEDRQYARDDVYHGGSRGVFRGSGMGAMDVVTTIIVANVAVYFLMFYTAFGGRLAAFGVMQAAAVWHGQIWRLFTATYMHAGFGHIFVNMLMLYFFGPLMERRWGGRQFFIVYTLGGIAGNVLLTLAGALHFIDPRVPGLGASGSVWTLMAAAAMYYPNTELLIYFLFPVRLRTAVTVYFVWFVWNILNKGGNYGGDMCHLAGLLFGVWWAKTGGWAWAGGAARGPRVLPAGFWKRLFGKAPFRGPKRVKTVPFRERVAQRKVDAATVDRILAKVYEKGIYSLTPEEKRALNEATERLRAEEAQADRTVHS